MLSSLQSWQSCVDLARLVSQMGRRVPCGPLSHKFATSQGESGWGQFLGRSHISKRTHSSLTRTPDWKNGLCM